MYRIARAKTILKKRFLEWERDGEGKVLDLKSAIKRYIGPDSHIHLSFTGSRWPTAAIYEIARAFYKTSPRFTISSLTVSGPVSILAHLGMVKEVITSYLGDSYHTIRPNPVYNRLYREKRIKFSNWTLLTFLLRLVAGGMNIPFFPSQSIVGSSIENEAGLERIRRDGNDYVLLPPLCPDITIIHTLCADKFGNAILFPPFAEGVFGVLASKRGAIVTTEKIVPSSLIRSHSFLCKLPSYYVLCVCEVPFGAHPGGVTNFSVEGVEGYMEDYDFFDELHNVSKDKDEFSRWIFDWVISVGDHEGYLKKLGEDRLLKLKGRVLRDSYIAESFEKISQIDFLKDPTPIERAIIFSAQKLSEIIKDKNYKTILSGAGLANLASSLCYYLLKEGGIDVDLCVEMGLFGYAPRPFDPVILNFRNHPTCKVLDDIFKIMGFFVTGRRNRCIGCLGTGQIDKFGNLNTTYAKETFIGGSGGANDVASGACEVLVLAIQSKDRFVDKVSYVTSCGNKVKTVVTQFGFYEKVGDELWLSGYFLDKNFSSEREHIERIKDNCGFSLKMKEPLKKIDEPDLDALITLRLMDPKRYFIGKI